MAFVRLRMHENSVFAILLRSRWWISFLVGAGLFGLARLFIPATYAIVIPIPFFVIGCVAAWRQLRVPSAARVARELEALREMSWEEFSGALEAAYQRDGYRVQRARGAGFDLELERDEACTLVAAKRWKVARTGAEPLRELHAAGRDANALVYVATGEVTAQARAYAAANGIRIVEGGELTALLAGSVKPAR